MSVFNIPVKWHFFSSSWSNYLGSITGNLYIPIYITRPTLVNSYRYIVGSGLTTELYDELYAQCPDFTTPGYTANYDVTGNFKNYFPSFFGYITNGSASQLAIESLQTGLIWAEGRSNRVYRTIQDVQSNSNYIFYVDFGFGGLPGNPYYAERWNGSGASRGTANFFMANATFTDVIKYGVYGCNPESTDIQIKLEQFTFANQISNWLVWATGGRIPDIAVATNDPYQPGGESSDGGGTGDFDNTGDDIDFPSLPSLGATDTGFISLFNPSLQELKDLASYMWSSSFDVALYKKLFADPMECILGLSIVPVSIPDAGRGFISVGNMVTPVWMNRAGAQYIEVDCGSINVNEYWGSYLDYEPHTKAEIYLPYCGIHPISIDDIMGKTVAVKYHVDILSGACCAYVKCDNAVLYTFIGQCASSIPITGNDWTNVINGVLSAAVSVGTMVATGGLTAPMAVSSIASTAVNGIKPSIEKSGAMGGTGGMLAIQTPYLILTRPRQALPASQNAYAGYPSYITASLGTITGYTEIESVHLHNIPATSEELSEIENLLKSGVIL